MVDPGIKYVRLIYSKDGTFTLPRKYSVFSVKPAEGGGWHIVVVGDADEAPKAGD